MAELGVVWKTGRAWVAPLALATVLAARPEARADAPATDVALAEALFQEARQLMAAGKTAEACPKLAESQRLDPATGTLLNLAVCHEEEGKLATAWAEFNEALSRARADRRSDREKLARERIAALEPRLPRLTIVVDRARQPGALTVELDGVAVGPAAWGTATPVDPGTHEVRAAAPGKQPWNAQITAAEPGQKLSVQVPALEDVPVVSAPAPTPPLAAAASPTAPPAPVSAQPGSSRRLLGVGLVAGGAASLAVGSIFGLHAFNRWSDRNRNCPMNMCTAEAVRAANHARTAANVSNVAFGVGVAAAAIGTYFILSPSGERPSGAVTVAPIIDLDNPGVGVACAF